MWLFKIVQPQRQSVRATESLLSAVIILNRQAKAGVICPEFFTALVGYPGLFVFHFNFKHWHGNEINSHLWAEAACSVHDFKFVVWNHMFHLSSWVCVLQFLWRQVTKLNLQTFQSPPFCKCAKISALQSVGLFRLPLGNLKVTVALFILMHVILQIS